MINALNSIPGIANISPENELRIRYSPNIYKCTPKNFKSVYFTNSIENPKPTESPLYGLDQLNEQYVRDGILIINAESPYIMGISPFYLQWRDEECSLTFKESNEKMVHVAKLQLDKNGDLLTEDRISLYTLGKDELADGHYEAGSRYVVLFDGINVEKNKLVGVKLAKKLYNGLLSSYSQIMFYNKDFRSEVCFKKMLGELENMKEQANIQADEEPMVI